MPSRYNHYPAQAFFFPAAILHALVVIPLTVLANTGVINSFGLLMSGHAQEMLAGLALALVAGYTLGNIPLAKAVLLLLIWIIGRFFALTGLSSEMATAATLLFGLMLAIEVLPRYKAAKRWRNLAQLPLLGAVALLPGIWALLRDIPYSILDLNVIAETSGILFLTLLMLFMAGRLIAPAAAGDYYNRGSNLKDRVQPNIEGALLITIPVGISLVMMQFYPLAGVVLVVAGILAAVRLCRWQLWYCKGRTDLYGLGIGYAWLAAGLIATGTSMILDSYHPAYLHIMTVGALGTLSTGIMSRWFYYYSWRTLPSRGYILLTVTAILLAALARLAVIFYPAHATPLLWISVAGWELAYGAAFYLAISSFLNRKNRPEKDQRPHRVPKTA